MNLDGPIYLQRSGMLTKERNRILDIGPQTIYFVRDEQIREFVANQGGGAGASEAFERETARLVHFSTPRAGERTTTFSEITDLTNIVYDSIDVRPGVKNTEILDLNFDALPRRMRGGYDVVFNFGTTEHVFNQSNCFELIHDALKVDGVVYHQLPASGYLDHGYYCYTPLFFKELAAANGYMIEHMAVSPAGESRIDALAMRSIAGETLLKPPGPLGENNRIPALNIHVVMRKTRKEAFRVSLETAHADAPSVSRRFFQGLYRKGGQADSASATALRELQGKYDEGRAAFDKLQNDVTELTQSRDEYRSALETSQAEATRLQQHADGYHAAYEEACAGQAIARDERDRILRSLEKLNRVKSTLPSRLDGRQLCFLHIGKTAGTSLQESLFETMSDAAIFHDSITNFDTVSPAEIAINDLVIGHYTFQHVAKLRPDRFLFTFLRDPVDRVVSNYYFLRAGSPVSHYSARALQAARQMTLREFCLCEDPGVRLVTENHQAKALAYDVRPELQHTIDDLAAQANRNLAAFDFIGLVEYFSESVAALSEEIGLALPVKRSNVTELRARQPRPSAEDVALIRSLNAVDTALYAKARERFERTVLRSGKTQLASVARPV